MVDLPGPDYSERSFLIAFTSISEFKQNVSHGKK